MSFRKPSQVSATTGRLKSPGVFLGRAPCLMFHAITASRTTPTLCVLVIRIGVPRHPDSSTQVVPVISPLPLSEYQAAKARPRSVFPRGRMAVTPVRTGPFPTTSFPSPEISVV